MRDRPNCDLCDCLSEVTDAVLCPCGGTHIVCLGCCFRETGLLTDGGRSLTACPLSDEYRVARELMGGEPPPKHGVWDGIFPGRERDEPDRGTRVEGLS